MTDKKGLVPVVQEGIKGALIAEISQRPADEYVVDVIARLAEDNPGVREFLLNFARACPTPSTALYAGVVVYRLLESQSEADKMAREMR